MPYVPDLRDSAAPLITDPAESAAEEFRVIKQYLSDIGRHHTFKLFADMVASTVLQLGDTCSVLNRVSSSDAGGCEYTIVSNVTGTVDNGSIIQLTGVALRAEAIFSADAITLEQFGVLFDNSTDNITALNAAIAFQQTDRRKLIARKGFCKFSTAIEVFSSTWIEGDIVSRSRSSTGDINDDGAVFKYTGGAISTPLIHCNLDGSQGYVHGLKLKDFRLDCNVSELGVELQGLNEHCVLEHLDIGNYTHGGLRIVEHDSGAGRFVSNQCRLTNIKLVPVSTVAKTAYGAFFSELHRSFLSNITVDAQASNSTHTINYGLQFGVGCYGNVGINLYAENCDNPFILGEFGGNNATIKNNTFIGCSGYSPQFEPSDTTFGSETGTIAIGVHTNVKWYSFLNFECSKAFGSSPYSYDYLLADANTGRTILRSNVSSSSDRAVFIEASENRFGRKLLRTDNYTVDSSVHACAEEISLTANNTYPNVEKCASYKTNNSGATTVTGFDLGIDGQFLEVRINDTVTTFDNGNNVGGTELALDGGVDLTTPAVNSIICFRLRGSVWAEISRSLK